MKKVSKKIKKIIVTVTILLLLVTPNISNAAYMPERGVENLIVKVLQQKYQDINDYREFLNIINSFASEIDKTMSTYEAKIEIIDKIKEIIEEQFPDSTVIPKMANQLLNQVISSPDMSTQDLTSILSNSIVGLLRTPNLAIESLTPDVVIENMMTTTAGRVAGEEYNTNLSANIYYADIDENGQPISDRWVLLIHGSQMNGQAIADAVGEMYLDLGFNILAPDLRGHGNSDGSVAMGYLESLDAWDWLTYLNKNYPNNCSEIIMHGVSLGGATTLFTSGLEIDGKTLKDKKVIGLIEDCGYTSMIGIIKGMLGETDTESTSDNGTLKNTLVSKILGIFEKNDLGSLNDISLNDDTIKTILIEDVDVGLTEENFDTYQNALTSLEKSELPLLIIHGTSDIIVPFENSDEIYQTAMDNEKIPYVQRYIEQGQAHAFIVLGTHYNVYEGHVENFIKTAEKIAGGAQIEKESTYQQLEPQNASMTTNLVKALKLIKNILNKYI